MTPANRSRVRELAEHFRTLADENPGASATMFAILKAQDWLTTIAMDLHFRPEINSEKGKV